LKGVFQLEQQKPLQSDFSDEITSNIVPKKMESASSRSFEKGVFGQSKHPSPWNFTQQRASVSAL
jgi:hypothetical protein